MHTFLTTFPVKGYVESGGLVPDETVTRIVAARLSEEDAQAGFILDGFPRTDAQAFSLSEMTRKNPIDSVLYFDVNDEMLIRRLSGRESCNKCGEIYNTKYRLPKQTGICDRCGAALMHRKDDQSDTVKARLALYKRETVPLIQFYEAQGVLVKINAEGTFEEVSRQVKTVGSGGRGSIA